MKPDDTKSRGLARAGSQPVAIAAVVLVLMILGVGSITLWRGYTGNSPEQDRLASTRQIQARTAQASEQLVEKTKSLEATQQESIDQLQVVQDQLQTVRRLLAAQQSDSKRLSEQVGSLTTAIESLRESFASAQSSEASSPPSAKPTSVRKARAGRSASVHRKRPKARG